MSDDGTKTLIADLRCDHLHVAEVADVHDLRDEALLAIFLGAGIDPPQVFAAHRSEGTRLGRVGWRHNSRAVRPRRSTHLREPMHLDGRGAGLTERLQIDCNTERWRSGRSQRS